MIQRNIKHVKRNFRFQLYVCAGAWPRRPVFVKAQIPMAPLGGKPARWAVPLTGLRAGNFAVSAFLANESRQPDATTAPVNKPQPVK